VRTGGEFYGSRQVPSSAGEASAHERTEAVRMEGHSAFRRQDRGQSPSSGGTTPLLERPSNCRSLRSGLLLLNEMLAQRSSLQLTVCFPEKCDTDCRFECSSTHAKCPGPKQLRKLREREDHSLLETLLYLEQRNGANLMSRGEQPLLYCSPVRLSFAPPFATVFSAWVIVDSCG